MSYRHRRYRRSRQSHTDSSDGGIFDEIGELIALVLADLLRAIIYLLSRLARWLFAPKRPAAPASPAPGDRPTAGHAQLPYRRVASLLTKGEHAFWYPLSLCAKGRYRLFCKVRLADVVTAGSTGRSERHWFNKVRGYHLDFVVCDPRSLAPLLAIELDDRSHKPTGRRRRIDEFKDAVLAAAGVPLYRVRAQPAYDPAQLRATIDRLIAATMSPTPAIAP